MKLLKWTPGIVIALVLFLVFVAIRYFKAKTKKNSPEQTVVSSETLNGSEAKILVDYSRPFKKGRAIFGGIVPFGKVWRTGANENTVFITNRVLTIDGKKLPSGKYSFWTIPEKDKWKVIWNLKQYFWGIKAGQVASREPEFDVLTAVVPTQPAPSSLEQFTISMTKQGQLTNLNLAWDQTQVTVPMTVN